MKKSFVIATIILAFLASCSSNKKIDISSYNYYHNFKTEIRKHEWTSFDVEMKRKNKRGKVEYGCLYHVIINNTPDSLKSSVALFTPYNSILLTMDSVTYIKDDFAEIATFGKNCTNHGYNLFEMLAYESIDFINYFESYSPVIEKFSHAYFSDESSCLKERKEHYKINGFVTCKECSTKECHLVEVSVAYFFNSHTGILDSAIENYRTTQTEECVKNLSHLNKQNIIDSVFNIYADKYKNYSVQINDSLGIYSRSSLSNVKMNKNVLEYPLINARTLDTTTLNDFNGWTLLCLQKYFNYTKSYIEEIEAANLPVDNIVYLMPNSDNLVYIKPWVDSLDASANIFYAKKISQVLSMYNTFYLISPQKETVFYTQYFINDDYSPLLKAKAEYEKQHNLKP